MDLNDYDVIDLFNQTVKERQLLDLIIYDYYINPFIPEDFWEPVTISLSTVEIENLLVINTTHYEECIICYNDKNTFKGLSCCNNKICQDCTESWFSCSTKCPFCIRDLR